MGSTSRVARKIKALLEINTKNGATKYEMESALEKANQLMLQYHIAEHELIDDEVVEKCISKSFTRVKSQYDLTSFFCSLCKLFDCEHYYTKSEITFFGYEKDVDLAGYFYDLITRACISEKDKFLVSREADTLREVYHGKTLSVGFIRGFLHEVSVKMHKMYKDRKRTVEQRYGLMVIDKENMVKNQFSQLDLKITPAEMNESFVEELSYSLGRERGEEFHLTQGIERNENVELISQ